MNRDDLIDGLIAHFGGQKNTAIQLGVTQPAVSAWKRGGGMRPRIARKAELATGGLFKATDLCPELAPDVSEAA